jgi:hypothetical protein
VALVLHDVRVDAPSADGQVIVIVSRLGGLRLVAHPVSWAGVAVWAGVLSGQALEPAQERDGLALCLRLR